MLVPRLAIRNLLRHWRRSLITGLAVALGLAMLMFSSAGTDGLTDNMIANSTGASAGHVVVQGIGWQELREAAITVPDSPAVVERVRRAAPEAHVVQRIFLDGLLTSSSGSVGVALSAVVPEQEVVVNDLPDKLVEGTYLDDNPQGIVVGRTLAENLDVGVGDKVVLMTQGPDGIESRLFRLQGIYSFGVDELDGLVAHIRIEAAQELLGLGSEVTQVSLHLDDADDTTETTEAVRAALADREVEVLPWQDALPMIADYVASENAEIYVIYGVLFVMVGLGILNTVLMSVLERLHEFAVMLAIGGTPGQLAAIVLVEGVVLGFVASVGGIGLGWLILLPLMASGLDLSVLYGTQLDIAGVPLDLVIYFEPSWSKILAYGLFTWAMTVAASLVPAWQASQVRPTEHIHHI